MSNKIQFNHNIEKSKRQRSFTRDYKEQIKEQKRYDEQKYPLVGKVNLF